MSWQDIQLHTFTAWINDYLKDRGMHINDLKTDLKDGVALLNLLEIISGKPIGKRWNKNPRVPNQKYENNQIAIEFVQAEGLKLVNIGGVDITDGNLRITLGLIWTLILRYQVNRGGSGDENAKSELLKWVQSKIPEYNVTGFKKDAVAPGSFPHHAALDSSKAIDNCDQGINTANDVLGIPKLLTPEALSNPRIDEQSVITYISYFRNADLEGKNRADELSRQAAKCRAYGPGLVEAVAGEPADFVVDTPTQDGKLEIKVEGPAGASNVPVQVNKKQGPGGAATYDVSYNPTTPGLYKVHVTYNGIHIPGSVFTVRILEAISLGGEGKIRVFYSTTSSTEKGRRDVFDLQRLLEAKKVHLRPDFEPWIAVDIMEKDDRDAVFKKAGTRNLPIVFIDDKYVGDFDTVATLEENGKLNSLLKFNERA
ncbi:calponin domain containing protein [Acanthamoeba castellanii str. Neff]|uniref:Calponin domain containing protein n=1 Tax=Acanthamoeba castellanii (strain ATCC 30010 / Neff) TaxID=1257118 RepID=L8GRJ6_ACACF|nr:calponin domain containing protein [Acanthamoeba castellanii str. Neff]ELR15268.1 calponin domain containing protein [Acanthamoeba castellanii str. Neff]